MLAPVLAALALASPPLASEDLAHLRKADLSHTPEVARFREQYRAKHRNAVPHAAGAAPSTGLSVSDIGRITVMRDTTHDSWEEGSGIDDVFTGTEDTITAFFEAHPDSTADFVMIIQDWTNLAFPGAFYLPLQNETTGIGYQHAAPSETFDDDPRNGLDGFLWLNGYGFLISGLFEDGRILWGQEFGHRWGAFVNVDDGGGLDDAVLGRQSAHWSYFLDTDWSWMEGNDWIDNLDGTFTTNLASYDPQNPGFSQLDLYLMGLVGTADVPAFTLLEPAAPGIHGDSDPPQAWPSATPSGPVTISATPRTLTIQDVIAAEGPRVPSHLTSQKSFNVAVVYALRRDDRMTAEKAGLMEALLDEFSDQWEVDTQGLATVTFGVSGTANAPPALAAITGPDVVKAGKRATFDASAAVDPESQALTFFWRWDADDDDVMFEPGEATQGHTFRGDGIRTIEVSVRDASGGETIVPFTLEIEPGSGGGSGCGCALGSSPRAPLGGMLALGAMAASFWVGRRRYSGWLANGDGCAVASPSRTGASATVQRSAGAS